MTGNAVARSGQQLLTSFRMPVCRDPAFDYLVDQVIDPHPADVKYLTNFSERHRSAAQAEMELLAPLAAPASKEVITAWLWPIADAVEWTPSEGEFFRRAAALYTATREIPNVAWTLKKQAEGMREWSRFPSVSAVMDLIIPPVWPLIRRIRALKRIIESG